MICLGVYGIATTAKIFGVFQYLSKNKIMGPFSGDSVLSEPVDNKTIEKNNELMNSIIHIYLALYHPCIITSCHLRSLIFKFQHAICSNIIV